MGTKIKMCVPIVTFIVLSDTSLLINFIPTDVKTGIAMY